jgi:hypothetical protein
VANRFLGAFKCGHRFSAQEYIDDDFAFELLEKFNKGDDKAGEALEWIAKYNNEYYRGVLKKNDKSAIHNTDRLYKEATDSHNQRRRDIISAIRSGKMGGPKDILPTEACVEAERKDKSRGPANVGRQLCEQLNKNRNLDHESVALEIITQKRRFSIKD